MAGDLKQAWNASRRPPPRMADPGPGLASEPSVNPRAAHLLAQHALDVALGAVDSAKAEVAAMRQELEGMRVELAEHRAHVASVVESNAQLAGRVDLLSAHKGSGVKEIKVQRDKDDRISGATVKEG